MLGLQPYVLALLATTVTALPQRDDGLVACGEAFYYSDKVRRDALHAVQLKQMLISFVSQYTCYDGDFLCPVLNGVPTLRCGLDCYLPEMYSCGDDGKLVYPPSGSDSGSASTATVGATESGPATSSSTGTGSVCSETPTTLHLSDPPYENYFYSDCNGANQIVVTSPLSDSNLTIIGPRLLVAWPAGNSGTVAFFAPRNGVNGSLGIELVNGTSDQPLSPVYDSDTSNSTSGNPRVGVSALIRFNSSATLTVPILGSIRTIRDFTEGPSILIPEIQNATTLQVEDDGTATFSRLWLDNETTTIMSFGPAERSSGGLSIEDGLLSIEAGTYRFSASFDYPQLEQLSAVEVLNEESQGLITQNPDQTQSLSFLSYSQKLLAGAWRFLTYFGR